MAREIVWALMQGENCRDEWVMNYRKVRLGEAGNFNEGRYGAAE